MGSEFLLRLIPPVSERLLTEKSFSKKPDARTGRESQRKQCNGSSQFSGEGEANSSLPIPCLI